MGKSLLMNTCRLRKFRKSAHLTQREVAMLVGYASQRAYSDVELGLKRPALGTALGCCILFNASLHDLFPDLAGFVGRDVLARARKLNVDLAKNSNREAAASNIADIISRIGGSSTPE
jgi:transcriptional regulator with XRE-family HTH domain